jgi:hypothetical protein
MTSKRSRASKQALIAHLGGGSRMSLHLASLPSFNSVLGDAPSADVDYGESWREKNPGEIRSKIGSIAHCIFKQGFLDVA